jgi:hypothetical protein
LIDGRHFSDVIDAYIDSDHMLVVLKLSARIGRTSNIKSRFAVDRPNDNDVASRYYDRLESALQTLEETIQRVATNTIGYTRKQANNEWFDKECAKVNKEKNAAIEQAIQIKTRGANNYYKLARTKVVKEFVYLGSLMTPTNDVSLETKDPDCK